MSPRRRSMRPACSPWSSPGCSRAQVADHPVGHVPDVRADQLADLPVPAREHRLPADRPAGPVDPRRPSAMSPLPGRLIAAATIAVFLAVVLLRPIWVFPATICPGASSARPRPGPGPSWQAPTVVSWAGMRGVVTLAAAFTLPDDTPDREVLVLHRARRGRGHAARPGLDPALAGPAAPAARPGSRGGRAAGGRRTARRAPRRPGEKLRRDRRAGRPARGGRPAPAAW